MKKHLNMKILYINDEFISMVLRDSIYFIW